MNKNLVRIYALIMLECRLSLEDASRIFGVDKELLKENLETSSIVGYLYSPIKYLNYETSIYKEENSKGIWKANIYIRQLAKILKIQDLEERRNLLNAFIADLHGPDIDFAKNKKNGYSDAEKKKILKYRLKYAKSGNDLKEGFHLDNVTLQRWEENLPEDDEMKKRLQILREYFTNKYFGFRRYREKNNR